MSLRPACLTLALAALLPLAGCDRLTTPSPSGTTAPTPLAVTATVQGELTSASDVNFNDGSRFQRFELALKADQAVELALSGPLEGRMGVFQDRQLISQTGASAPGFSDGGPGPGTTRYLAFRAPADGTYSVAVSGQTANDFGPFTLASRPIEPYNGAPLAPGNDAVDWLVAERQEYTVSIDKAGLYDINLSSAAFDTVLELHGQGMEMENDDYGNGTHSRLQVHLEPGQYTAGVRGLGSDDRGAFRLSVTPSSLPEGTVARDGTSLPLEGTVSGLVDSRGIRRFVLELDAQRQVTLDARSNDIDTVLVLTGQGVSREDDDGGNGTNARLTLHLSAGRYNVEVRSLGGNPGPFVLQTSSSPD